MRYLRTFAVYIELGDFAPDAEEEGERDARLPEELLRRCPTAWSGLELRRLYAGELPLRSIAPLS